VNRGAALGSRIAPVYDAQSVASAARHEGGAHLPEFINPFSGLTPGRKLTLRELARALRLSLAAEEEAVHLYEALADATEHRLAQAVLQDIADEERVHAGEFQRLISLLLADEDELMKKGADEVDEIAEALNGDAKPAAGGSIPTIGSMKE